MLRFFISLFIFVATLSFANLKDNYLAFLKGKEPNALFDGCVNIITGNFVLEDEIVANGKEPIKLKKSYFSLNNFDLVKREEKDRLEFVLGGFSYKGMSRVLFYGNRVDIVEPTGEIITFLAPSNVNNQVAVLNYKSTTFLPKFFHQKDLNKRDLKKIRVEMRGLYDLFIFYPDGTEKYFRRDNIHLNEYFLRSEKLLNQNILHYFYDRFNHLTEIRSTNLASNKIYAWIRFNYLHPEMNYSEKHKDKYDFDISTSDGNFYSFRFKDYAPLISNKERAKRPFYILENDNCNISNNHYDYLLDYKQTHPLLKNAKLSDQREKEINYYLLGNKNPEVGIEFFDPTDFRFERVKTLKEKNSLGAYANTYKFYYENATFNQTGAKTTVIDSKNNKYVYFYNKDFKIVKIQRFENRDKKDFLVNEERYQWEKRDDISILVSKMFFDKNAKAILEIKYFYDEKNNLIEEKILGDISGENKLDSISKRKKYSLDDRNLLIEEIDEKKVSTKYYYLPNTNIISAKILSFNQEIKKRIFYEYNADYILTKKIQDDGFSLDKKELTNVTFRRIKYIYPYDTGPFLGFINVIEEKYLDLKNFEEKLIRKKVYSYSEVGKIIKKDIFDSLNKHKYSLFYEYDKRKNLISKTDLLNKKTSYSYALNNNKISKSIDDAYSKIYSYDMANNIIKKQIKKGEVTYEKSDFFDERNNKIHFIDYLGDETFYEYDNFSNLIKKTTKDSKHENPIQTYFSYDSFGNISKMAQDQDALEITYNIFFKPTHIKYQNGSAKRFIYYLDGSIKTFIDEKGVQTHFEHDYLNRVVNKKISSFNGVIIDEKRYLYNLFGLIEKQDNNQITKYFYDCEKKLIKEEKHYQKERFDICYFYDSLSRVYKTIYNNEIIKEKSIDLLGRILKERVDIKFKPFYEKSFVYTNDFSLTSYLESKKKKNKVDLFDLQSSTLDTKIDEIDYLLYSKSKDKNEDFRSLDKIFLDFIKTSFFNSKNIYFIPDIFKDIFMSSDQKNIFFIDEDIKNPNIFSLNLFLYNDLDLESVFLEKSFFDFDKRKVKIVFSQEALLGMQRSHLLLKQVLKALKMPSKIDKIEENEFLISYKNLKAIVNIEKDEIFYIENIRTYK